MQHANPMQFSTPAHPRRRLYQAPLQQWDTAAPWRATPLPGENLTQLVARVRRERRWFGLLELI